MEGFMKKLLTILIMFALAYMILNDPVSQGHLSNWLNGFLTMLPSADNFMGMVVVVLLWWLALATIAKLGIFAWKIWDKVLLLNAITIRLPRELSRASFAAPKKRVDEAESIYRRIAIDGGRQLIAANTGGINISTDHNLANAARELAEFKRKEEATFRARRWVVRCYLDAYVALVDHPRSTNVAWHSTIAALERLFQERSKHVGERIELSLMPQLARLLEPPWDIHSADFYAILKEAKQRGVQGKLSLVIARNLCDYVARLEYSVNGLASGGSTTTNLRGYAALEAMREYQV
jgi:hypothetical protein